MCKYLNFINLTKSRTEGPLKYIKSYLNFNQNKNFF